MCHPSSKFKVFGLNILIMAFRLLIGNLFYFVSEFSATTTDAITSSFSSDTTVTSGMTSVFPTRTIDAATSSLSHDTTVTPGKSASRGCRLPGFLYRGNRNVTVSGLVCQRWDMQSPHAQNYFVFSLAQENYCRNFDREEPWCYTSNSSVRWELCGVNVCTSPCLNQSFYTQQITSQCLSAGTPSDEFCSRMWSTVECLKSRIEISSGVSCSGIELKSIALQRQNVIERLMGRSISQCVKAPCTDSLLSTIKGLVKYANPCNLQNPIEKSTSETLCRNFQRVANCIASKIADETNATCLTKDKASTAKQFESLVPQDAANVSLCISKISEFPASSSEEEDSPNIDPEMGTNVNTTQLFVAIGFAILFIIVGILIISLITMRKMLLRKRRKELLRLPSVPKTQSSSYESKFTVSNDPYIDPDYEVIEEQDGGYEQLGKLREENETQINEERMSAGSYVNPNNADGTYLDAVHTTNEACSISYMNISPYIELTDDPLEGMATKEVNDVVQEQEEISGSPEST